MPESNNPSPTSVEAPGLGSTSFDNLWTRWGKQMDWRQKVEEQATRKALDIPGDDMNINVDKSVKSSGVSSIAALGLAAGAALLGGGIPTALLLGSRFLATTPSQSKESNTTSTTTTQVAPQPVVPPPTAYQVQFFDDQMQPLHIDRLPFSP